jgi:16S rRNA processing protein RimM
VSFDADAYCFSRVSASDTPPAGTPLIQVGRVGRSHGLDGSFVVEQASEDPQRFAPGARVLVDGEPATVAEAKRAGSRLVVRLDRAVDRGAILAVPRDKLPQAGVDEYYVFDLTGLRVEEEDGRALGRVQDVAPGVANDVLELDTGLALPLVEDCVLSVDLEQGVIVVAPGFGDQS